MDWINSLFKEGEEKKFPLWVIIYLSFILHCFAAVLCSPKTKVQHAWMDRVNNTDFIGLNKAKKQTNTPTKNTTSKCRQLGSQQALIQKVKVHFRVYDQWQAQHGYVTTSMESEIQPQTQTVAPQSHMDCYLCTTFHLGNMRYIHLRCCSAWCLFKGLVFTLAKHHSLHTEDFQRWLTQTASKNNNNTVYVSKRLPFINTWNKYYWSNTMNMNKPKPRLNY